MPRGAASITRQGTAPGVASSMPTITVNSISPTTRGLVSSR
jgi:hypothetical protein